MITRIVLLLVLISVNTGNLFGQQTQDIVVETAVNNTSLADVNVVNAITGELGSDSLLVKDVESAYRALVANGTVDRIYKKRFNTCGFDDTDHIILILLMFFIVILFLVSCEKLCV